jgi:phosphate transport system ATP-binding protein
MTRLTADLTDGRVARQQNDGPGPAVRPPRFGHSPADPQPSPTPGGTGTGQAAAAAGRPLIRANQVSVFYGSNEAIKKVSVDVPEHSVVAFIGPSGCGKSTFLRSINRLNDLIPGCRVTGEMHIAGKNVYDPRQDMVTLRREVGLVFQKPNPFPKSIFDNIAYGPRLQGVKGRAALDELVEDSLRKAAIWDETKDRLHSSALGLSGGQQQRLCIARALATKPRILLMDEPCSALDPIATSKIEDLIGQLKASYTIVMVTHNMQQAARVSDFTAFFYLGTLIEYDRTATIFTNPSNQQTNDYVTGRFG